MDNLVEILGTVSGFVWGPYCLIPLLVGTGLFLTIRLGFVQFRRFVYATGLVSGRYDDPGDEGEISHFQALSAALSATIGTGNIAGVATAIASGGPGAVFWMWITALVGMAAKYSSCLLALKYRKIDENGTVAGGPMYTIEKGMGRSWKPLAVFFAVACGISSFGIGNMVQANSVADALSGSAVTHLGLGEGSVIYLKGAVGVVLAVLTGLVIIGGIRRIGSFASKIVPFMAIVYVVGAVVILLMKISAIPEAFGLIFSSAFSPTAAAGGVLGHTVAEAVRFGVARGVFSNESGLGSAPMAHAAAKTRYPAREGLVAMLGPFIDTLLICTMTALVILVTRAWIPEGGAEALTGAPLSQRAFREGLPGPGGLIVSFGLVFFAFSTLISWSYYGDRAFNYLLGRGAVVGYRWIYCLLIPVGAVVKLEIVWKFSDIMNGLMALPNLVSLVVLSGVVAAETKGYFAGVGKEHP